MSRLQQSDTPPLESAPPSAFGDVIVRDRYQISVGVALAVGVPMIVRGLVSDINILEPNQYNTIILTTIAIIFGYISFKKIHVFPGITSSGYITTSLTLWFSLISIIFLFARLPYTTVQIFFGYIVSVAFFTFVNLFFVNRRTIRLGVVPSPSISNLPEIRRVEWLYLAHPHAAISRLNGVIVDLHETHSDEWSNRIADFALEGVPVYHFKDAIENLLGHVEIEKLSENTLGSLNPNDVYLAIKSFIDRMAAIVVLLLLAPIMLAVSVAIKLDSPGPILFRQRRMGFRKRPFTVFKFRTMYHVPDSGARRMDAITVENDPRITRVGRFLRKYRFDELPQLFNIIRGEMSLIGPRPEAVALTEWYEKEIPFYHYRHIIKPGITGWAQVNQGHVSAVSDVTRKLHLDFYYVKHFSFWLDVYITLKTIRVILKGHGAK